MNLEGIASPPPRPPAEIRYANLHRTIDGGLVNDRVLADLVETCAELGRVEEAAQALEQIQDLPERRHARFRAGRHGVRLAAAGSSASNSRDRGLVVDTKPTPTVEHLGDAIRFLFSDHLPMTAIVATILLPLLIGLSGFLLTNVEGNSVAVFAILAASPALLVLGLVATLTAETLRQGRRGIIDPPSIPRLGELTRNGAKTLRDVFVVLLAALLPSILILQESGSAMIAAPVALVLLSFAPMAFALRITEHNWHCARPGYLVGQIFRVRRYYPAVLVSLAVLFAPIVVGLMVTAHSPTFVSMAVVGLLGTGPALIGARLLGLVMHEADRREQKQRKLQSEPQPTLPDRQKRLAKRRPPRERRKADAESSLAAAETTPKPAPEPAESQETETVEIGAFSAGRGQLTDAPDIGHIPGATIVRRGQSH